MEGPSLYRPPSHASYVLGVCLLLWHEHQVVKQTPPGALHRMITFPSPLLPKATVISYCVWNYRYRRLKDSYSGHLYFVP
jgi:hypothetical protein